MKTLLTLFVLLFSSSVLGGDKVACGGEYSSWQHSRDGSYVCAGGEYSSWQHSRDGPIGTIKAHFDPNFIRFSDLSTKEYDSIN